MQNFINVKNNWEIYINTFIDESNLSQKTKERIKGLLKNVPKITLSSYKKIAAIEAEEEWNLYKSNNRDLFSNFFQRVYKDLEVYDIDYIEKVYGDKLKIISSTLGKNYEEILIELIHLNYYIEVNNTIQIANIKTRLIEYYRKFVMMYKKNYIDEFTKKKLDEIKDIFILVGNKKTNLMDIHVFINILKSNSDIIEILRKTIMNVFGILLSNIELERLLINMLSKEDNLACESLKIKKPIFYEDKDEMKALKRLRENYFSQIEKNIPINLYEYAQLYLNDPVTHVNLKSMFSKEQLVFFNDIISLMSQSKSKLDFLSNEKFISTYREFTKEDKELVKDYEFKISQYNKLKSKIYDVYKKQSELTGVYNDAFMLDKNNTLLPFDDDNYRISDHSYLFNEKLLLEFISKIDDREVNEMDSYAYLKLKEILNNNNLFASLLYGNFSLIKLDVLINNFSKIYNSTDFALNKDNLNEMFKKIKLYEYATSEQIELLGIDVVKKIITNNQFMSGNITPDDIRLRVEKAEDLMKRAEYIKKSAVPYNCDTYKNGVHITRYLNNDPNILVSGIDANTCFKLSANDNDFVFYTILNKNGFVLKFTDDKGNMLGRISGIRRHNILQFNSIRNVENSNIITSKEQYDLYNNMLSALEEYAQKIIDVTKDTDYPIDFVVTNKSGLLESSEFNDRYPLLNDHLFTYPIDIYDEDWKEFVHTYDNNKNYFQQVDENTVFTTDFGSYPVVLIKAREGKTLERLFDISYNSPEPIYIRPEKKHISNDSYSDDFELEVKRGGK